MTNDKFPKTDLPYGTKCPSFILLWAIMLYTCEIDTPVLICSNSRRSCLPDVVGVLEERGNENSTTGILIIMEYIYGYSLLNLYD